MTARITTAQFTFIIDGYQIDLCYLFDANMLEGYVDGVSIINTKYNPSRTVLSFTNMLHIAVDTLKFYHMKIER